MADVIGFLLGLLDVFRAARNELDDFIAGSEYLEQLRLDPFDGVLDRAVDYLAAAFYLVAVGITEVLTQAVLLLLP